MKSHLNPITPNRIRPLGHIGRLALFGSLLFSSLYTGRLHAQNDADLLRYSLLNPSGSPRFTAMGGAFGALGGNFSALTVNPAGMGLYSHHELSLSGSVTSANGRADYYGETHRDSEKKVNIPEAGFVWVPVNLDVERGLKRVQIGVGFNRINDYTGAFFASGLNPQSSYMEAVAAQNYGARVPDDYQDGTLNAQGSLAYNAYLLDNPDAAGNFSTFLSGGGLNQSKAWYTNGNISEISLAASANVSDKVYVGFSFGIPVVHYNYRSTLTESAATGGIRYPYNFRSYDLNERFSVSGAGFTFKIGLMYQVLPYMRVGAWFHTPTYYSFNEDYTVDLSAIMTLVDENGNQLPGSTSGDVSSRYRYDIQTPLRAGAALGFIIGRYGVVDVEGELVNYNGMKLTISDDRSYAQQINSLVRDQYQMGGILRVGTEWRAGIGRFRAGYVFQSSPFRDKAISKAWSNHTVSAGVGLAFGRWNIDFSVAYYLQTEDYYLYNIVDSYTHQPLVQAADLTQNKFVYNLGFAVKF